MAEQAEVIPQDGTFAVRCPGYPEIGGMTEPQAKAYAAGWYAAYTDQPLSRSELEKASAGLDILPSSDIPKWFKRLINQKIQAL